MITLLLRFLERLPAPLLSQIVLESRDVIAQALEYAAWAAALDDDGLNIGQWLSSLASATV